MSADKHQCIFLHQMEASVYMLVNNGNYQYVVHCKMPVMMSLGLI